MSSLAAAAGIAFAAGTIISLQISESASLFGFHEHGYRTAIVLSIAFEAAAIVLLTGYLAGAVLRRTVLHPMPASAVSALQETTYSVDITPMDARPLPSSRTRSPNRG